MPSSESWPVSLFRGARDKYPKPAEWSWRGMVAALTFPYVEPKKLESAAWSPARYPEGATRGAKDVEVVSCMVFDYDDGQQVEAVRECFTGYQAIAHTSWSHTPAAPKFRYILPLFEPIPGDVWSQVWRTLHPYSGGADPKCSDPSRLFFLPSIRRADWPFEAWTFEGDLLDLRDVAEDVRQKAKRRRARPVERSTRAGGDRELSRRLQEDPALRRYVGEQLGGQLGGVGEEARIVRVKCPQCGRLDVWWPLSPRGKGAAKCNHVQSCGWWGWLEDLWTN